MTHKADILSLQQSLYSSTNPTRQWLHCTRRDWILEEINNYSDKKGSALEIGPGAGVYVQPLTDAFSKVTVSDIESEFLDHLEPLQTKIPDFRCVLDDITASRLPRESFDLILCTEVIEHIPETDSVLANIRSLLKKDGILILTTPQRYSTLEICAKIAFLPGIIQAVRAIYKEPVLETGHINLKTSQEMSNHISAAGFEIVSSNKCGFYLPCVAEFSGRTGARLQQYFEKKIKDSFWDWILWTQCYVLKRME